MKKEKIISTILKIIAIVILLYGIWLFYDWRLWKESFNTNTARILKIFLPILVPSLTGILYGIATLLDKDKK